MAPYVDDALPEEATLSAGADAVTVPKKTVGSSALTNSVQLETSRLEAAIAKASHDFRSDVVTVPTIGMMQAILDASVGDDIYDPQGDASVNALQQKLIELTGMEDALWAISGTMGNQICLRTHLTQPPHTVLLDHRAHIHCWESGALPVLSQAGVTAVHPANGVHLTVEDVRRNIIADGNIHFPPTRVVALENTMSGVILPLSHAKEISEYVRSFPVPEGQKPVAMHLDAARLFDGVIGEGVDLKEYCKCFDSMSICLAKGLGAPMGSVILGSKRFIQRAKWFRKMVGGGARQPGMMAAAATAALDNSLPLFPRVHAMAKETSVKLQALGYKLALPVQTNMVVLDLDASRVPGSAVVRACESRGVAVFPNGRIVLHHQTSNDGLSNLVAALANLMQRRDAGEEFVDEDMAGGCS